MNRRSMIGRLLPAPVTSVAIAALWLLLNGVSNGHLVLAVVLALGLPHLLPTAAIASPRLAAPFTAIRLTLVVLYDIVKANIEIAVRILGPESRIRPTYVWVPLDIASPQGVSLFAAIITMTPGTLSCEVSEDRQWLLVHAFHADDAGAVATEVKSRYEAPLREIFR
jgi:multicomponent K+:H+ antiporter subunit E